MTENAVVASGGGWCIPISRDMALMYGLVEPTAQEAADRARDHERWRAENARTHARMADYAARLDALTDPAARAVLDLHAPVVEREHPKIPNEPTCAGCDYQGWESEPPSWPCRTVRAVGALHDIHVPEGVWW